MEEGEDCLGGVGSETRGGIGIWESVERWEREGKASPFETVAERISNVAAM